IIVIFTFLIGIVAPVVFADEDPGGEIPKLEWNISGYPSPEKSSAWFAEEAFYHERRRELRYDEDIYYDTEDTYGKERQFLTVTFFVDDVDDNEVELEFAGISDLISGVHVHGGSSGVSMVDINFLNDIDNMETDSDDSENPETDPRQDFIDKYIFIENTTNKNEATLYIPVKPLMPNVTYSVTLGPNIVFVKDSNKEGNGGFTWKFNTMAVPSVSERSVIVQSVVENYDVTEPIIIFGKFFDSHVEVFFNGINAYRTRVYEDEQKRYSTKREDNVHYDEEDEDNEGNNDIEQYLEVYLPRGRNRLEPGLYNITIRNSRNHSVELYGVLSVIPKARRKIPTEEDKYSTKTPYGFVRGSSRVELIRLDHKEPVKEEILRKQLSQYILKSPIVETSGSDYYTYIYSLEIPYTNGITNRLKVLRYDEFTRRWVEESCYINNIDRKAVVITPNGGAFVVVEPRY
ncbi:MAG TPA: hypothetical protein VFD17_02045, partial [Clostridia bacterium]|nr:hypothetical protein [Clostridia bacterium]